MLCVVCSIECCIALSGSSVVLSVVGSVECEVLSVLCSLECPV